MDIYCPRCGEPCDIDTLHDAAEEQDLTFDQVRDTFFTAGCGDAIGWRCEPVTNQTTALAAAAHDLLGDDIDGIASMMEDAEYMGLL